MLLRMSLYLENNQNKMSIEYLQKLKNLWENKINLKNSYTFKIHY